MRRAWAAVDMGKAKGTACQGRGSLSEGPACHPSSRDGVRKIPCYTALRLAWATGNPVLKREQSKEKQTFRLSKSPSQEEGQHQPINRRESSSTGKLRHRTSPPSSSSLKQNTPPNPPTQAQGFQEELGGRSSGAWRLWALTLNLSREGVRRVVGVGGGHSAHTEGPSRSGTCLAGNPQTPLIKETKSSTCLSFYMSKIYFMVFLSFFLFQ